MKNEKHTNEIDGCDLLESMQITKIEPRSLSTGGAWVTGTMGDHRFDALVFPEHAECKSYELDGSRISKLSVQNRSGAMVACFDRGWDQRPMTPMAEMIVALLAAGLAETTFGK